MFRSLFAGVLAGLLLAAAPKTPLAAQSLGITPYAGYMKFGSMVDGTFGTNVRAAGAPVYGAELQLARGTNLGLDGRRNGHGGPGPLDRADIGAYTSRSSHPWRDRERTRGSHSTNDPSPK